MQTGRGPLTIEGMPNPESKPAAPVAGAFAPGALVVVTLHTPREKFWGGVLELSPAGLTVRGVDLDSLEDFITLVRADEADPVSVFFPMYRVERIELDTRNGTIPSIGERFAEKTHRAAAEVIFPSRSKHP